MKNASRLTGLFLILMQSVAYAVTPVDGVYFGGTFGARYQAIIYDFKYKPLKPFKPDLGNKLGFNGGIQVGYRFFERYRVEGELIYAMNKNRFIRQNGVIYAPTKNQSLNGSMTTVGILLSGYFDFFFHKKHSANDIAPYLGLGLGYSVIQTSIKSGCSGCQKLEFNAGNKPAPIAQGVLGVSYWLDDFTMLGLDYRFLGYGKIQQYNVNKGYSQNVNLTMNFSYDS